jgi:methyl-accepting chemotaxis protein
MAQETDELHQAIEQTREEIGATVQGIAEKTDVKARAADKIAEGRDRLKESSAGARAKVDEVSERLEEKLPDAARPAVASAARWAGSATDPTAQMWRRWLPLYLGVVVVIALLARRSRRRRRVAS